LLFCKQRPCHDRNNVKSLYSAVFRLFAMPRSENVARRNLFPSAISALSIADEAWHLAHQRRSAWSFLTEMQSSGENW